MDKPYVKLCQASGKGTKPFLNLIINNALRHYGHESINAIVIQGQNVPEIQPRRAKL